MVFYPHTELPPVMQNFENHIMSMWYVLCLIYANQCLSTLNYYILEICVYVYR
jgi:hypothetical protein